MNGDLYVIVYRGGDMGCAWPKEDSDRKLLMFSKTDPPPVYRIRIREKPACLDPAKAYADAGLVRR